MPVMYHYPKVSIQTLYTTHNHYTLSIHSLSTYCMYIILYTLHLNSSNDCTCVHACPLEYWITFTQLASLSSSATT